MKLRIFCILIIALLLLPIGYAQKGRVKSYWTVEIVPAESGSTIIGGYGDLENPVVYDPTLSDAI